MSGIQLTYKIEGFLKVYDPNNGEVFVDKHNAINYENMSEAIADTLSSRGYGEIYQIDTPYLTEGSSGLTYVVDRFKGWDHNGHITLVRGERSRLADYAAETL